MNTFKILWAEIGYRKLNFALSLFAVTVATLLFVAGPMLVKGYSQATETELSELQGRVAASSERLKDAEEKREAELAELADQTRCVMRDMGFNLAILDRNADTIQFLAAGLPSETIPQELVDRLAEDPGLTMVTHLVATLSGEIDFGENKVRLVGYLPETPQSHKPQTAFAKKMLAKKKPMGYEIAPGTVILGYTLGHGRKAGETIEVLGREFSIAQILPEKGSREDITIAVHLSEAQGLLKKPGLINEIKALECRCVESALPDIRRQINDILPQVHVIRDTSRADARATQRAMVHQKHNRIIASHEEALHERQRTLEETENRREKIQSLMTTLGYIVTPLVVLVCAIWVGLLSLANVRERRTEIGILRALGKGSGTIATLFLGKAVLLGMIGAVAGLALGLALARWLGIWALGVARGEFNVDSVLLLGALIGAPLLSALASYLPTLSALVQDPAVMLRDQ